MGYNQAIINAIRGTVLDRTHSFTLLELFDLPRTGRLLRQLNATHEQVHEALLVLKCKPGYTFEGVVYYTPQHGGPRA